MAIASINPATGETFATFTELSEAEIENKITKADQAFQGWKKVSFKERANKMRKAGEILKTNARRYGEIMTREMGKPIKQSITEVEKCAKACDFYAEKAAEFLTPEKIDTGVTENYACFEPLGIVLAVMPWNFPFWQVLRFAAPTLMAGNTALLKHASNVPQCAEEIEKLFLEAGFPEGVFQNLLIPSSKVEKVLADPRVKAATLTGSEHAGSMVAMQCGKLIKPTVLELGGSDPFIVLADADLKTAAETGALARLQNTGQSCIAAKRFIVEKAVSDEFLSLFKAEFEKAKIGDPLKDETDIGPLSSFKAVDDLEKQVNESIQKGAKVITGGKRIKGKGAFFEPTILTDVKKGMPAYDEEMFGPVASVIVVDSPEEAIAVANDTPFGLGASLWTNDLKKAKILIPQIEAGAVFVNGMVKSDPRLPFGGIKRSGYGRELGIYGIRAFTNVKTVWIK